MDDALLYDHSVEEAFWHTYYAFQDTFSRTDITLQPEKFFYRKEVDFVGFHLGWESYQPAAERLTAIKSSMPDQPLSPSFMARPGEPAHTLPDHRTP